MPLYAVGLGGNTRGRRRRRTDITTTTLDTDAAIRRLTRAAWRQQFSTPDRQTGRRGQRTERGERRVHAGEHRLQVPRRPHQQRKRTAWVGLGMGERFNGRFCIDRAVPVSLKQWLSYVLTQDTAHNCPNWANFNSSVYVSADTQMTCMIRDEATSVFWQVWRWTQLVFAQLASCHTAR